ncbi:MAG: ABC transporter ATP-binding protein [Dehalococcoidales bacterium]
MPILKVSNIYLHYATANGVLPAVDGVSFTIADGETLGLVGESGAGKSSLALALMRLLPRNVATFKGVVELGDISCLKLTEEEFRKQIRWQKIAMVFQGAMDSLNPVIKVGQQVAEPLLLKPGVKSKQAQATAQQLLKMVMLPPEVSRRYPHELSGGMKQRVMIAMALVLNPELLIMDEPTSALDVITQAQIMNLLKKLKREFGPSILFITHDLALASDLCDSIAVMYAGEIVEMGTAEELLLEPKHPYSQKLLASIPRLAGDTRPEFIPGAPPDMTQLPPGCYFQPRCHRAFERCLNEHPPAFKLPSGRLVRCWLYGDRK